MSVTKVTGMMSTGTKGGDIPSASTLVIDTDGDYFDITGTTGITAMTVDAGRRFTLQFDGAVTLTHGSSLYLPGAVNFTTEANDCLSFIATAANTVRCTGYALKDGGSPVAPSGGAWNYISSATASSSSSLDFTSGIDSTYDVYLFSCVDLEFSANCEIRVRTGAGSFDTGASDYEIASVGYATYGNQPFGDDADDAIIISKASYQGGASTDQSASLRIFLYAPSDTTHLKKIEFCFIGEDSNGRAQFQVGVGQRSSTSAITRLQLYPHTGTITSGTIRMYGLAKS